MAPANSRPLQVCHINTMTNWGGVERLMIDSLTRVSQERVHHSLLTTSSTPEIVTPVSAAGVPVFEPSRRWRYDPDAVRQMARWLREHEIELVHTYDAHANSWGYLAARLAGIPFRVAGERGTIWGWPPPIRWLDCWAQRSADLIITNSQASATLLRHYYHIHAERIRVIHNAVAPLPEIDRAAIRSTLGLTPEQPLVGSLGRLVNQKGYDTFIGAASIVAKHSPTVRFAIVGGGPLECELRALRDARGLTDLLIMTGWRSDARALLQAFDIFVSTSVFEPFGNVLVEAALGLLPVIAPRIDGIPEVVVDGETGILLMPTKPAYESKLDMRLPRYTILDGQLRTPKALHPETLADAIVTLLSDPVRRSAMGHAGQTRAERLFSVDRYIRDLETTYLDLATSRRSS